VIETAMRTLAIGAGPGEVRDSYAGKKHDKGEHNYERDRVF